MDFGSDILVEESCSCAVPLLTVVWPDPSGRKKQGLSSICVWFLSVYIFRFILLLLPILVDNDKREMLQRRRMRMKK